MNWPTREEMEEKIKNMTHEEKMALVKTLCESLNEIQTALIAHGNKVFGIKS